MFLCQQIMDSLVCMVVPGQAAGEGSAPSLGHARQDRAGGSTLCFADSSKLTVGKDALAAHMQIQQQLAAVSVPTWCGTCGTN